MPVQQQQQGERQPRCPGCVLIDHGGCRAPSTTYYFDQLKCPDDDAFLVKFLRARKYNVDSAFKNIKKYFKVRRNHPELFDELDPDFALFDTVCRKHKLVTVSREKDPKGRAIVLLNLGTWNTNICKLDDFFRVGTAFVEHLLLDDEVQLKGVIFVMDFKNLGLYHLTQYTIPVIKRLFSLDAGK
ncbi:hypothetical protein MTO96_014916 [Rhipicephalus appendiculatus]